MIHGPGLDHNLLIPNTKDSFLNNNFHPSPIGIDTDVDLSRRLMK